MHDFYRNFCAAMDGREEMTVTHGEIRRVMQVMEAAFASDETHKTIDVDL